jgi:hypothetical protein
MHHVFSFEPTILGLVDGRFMPFASFFAIMMSPWPWPLFLLG